MRYTAVEPNVHDIVFLSELTAAALALHACRDEFGCILSPPCVASLLAEQFSDSTDGIIVADRLAAVLAVNNRYRNAPCSLTGDTPVASVTDHALDTVLAPLGYPLNALDSLDSLVLEAVY